MDTNRIGLSKTDYTGGKSTLCTGCGHDSITNHIITAYYQSSVDPYQVAKLSGIGCSSKTPAYFLGRSHGFNAIHGRMAPVATGVIAQRDEAASEGKKGVAKREASSQPMTDRPRRAHGLAPSETIASSAVRSPTSSLCHTSRSVSSSVLPGSESEEVVSLTRFRPKMRFVIWPTQIAAVLTIWRPVRGRRISARRQPRPRSCRYGFPRAAGCLSCRRAGTGNRSR